MKDHFGFLGALSQKSKETCTVYKSGEIFAQYSHNVAIDVAKEINGVVVSDETGEVLYEFE